MKAFQEGSTVKWDWGNGEGKGQVQSVYKEDVTKTLKGSEVTRNADPENPAYLIEQDDGDQVLKSHSELSQA